MGKVNLFIILVTVFISGMLWEKVAMPDLLGTRRIPMESTINDVNKLLESRNIHSYWFAISDAGDVAMRFKRPSFEKVRALARDKLIVQKMNDNYKNKLRGAIVCQEQKKKN